MKKILIDLEDTQDSTISSVSKSESLNTTQTELGPFDNWYLKEHFSFHKYTKDTPSVVN